MTLVGSDVVALFPSIMAKRTGRIFREEIETTEISFEGFDTDRARAYISINKDLVENLEDIEHLIPEKK